MSFTETRSAAAIVLSSFFIGVLSAPAAMAGSSASGAAGNFTTDGINTVLDPVNRLAGPGDRFSKSNSVGAVQRSLILSTGESAPELTVDAAKGTSHVEDIVGVDTNAIKGEASLSDLTVKIAPRVPPSSTVIPQPYLQITAGKAQESANYNLLAIVPSRTDVSSAGTIQTLKITGSLIGDKTLTFTGAAKPDTVLYQSDTLTITLNKKLVTALISCSLKCKLTPYGIAASAIDVTFNNAKLGTHTVSGDLSIASGSAGQGTAQ